MRKTYYLVDYENVNVRGLNGIENLTEDECIYVFYSDHANTINIDLMLRVRNVRISFAKSPSGAEMMDKYICSYVGYLYQKYYRDECNIVVISKDQGYSPILNKCNKNKVQTYLSSSINAYKTGDKVIENIKDIVIDSKDKTSFSNKIAKSLNGHGYSAVEIGKVQKLCCKEYDTTDRKRVIKEQLIIKYGQNQGTNFYELIKDIL